MATVTVLSPLTGQRMPLSDLPAVTRISGTATLALLDETGGTGLITLEGVVLSYGLAGQPLPIGGTITRIAYSANNGATTHWDATGLSLPANLLSAPGASLATLVFGGADTVTGGIGSDWLAGFGGNDVITGGVAADVIEGGEGNDTVTPGAGTDVALLGEGADLLVLPATDISGDVMDGGGGADTLRAGGALTAATVMGFETLQWISRSVAITLTGPQLAGFTALADATGGVVGQRLGLDITGGGFVDLGQPALFLSGAGGLSVTLSGAAGTALVGRMDSQAGGQDSILATSAGADSIVTYTGNDHVVSSGGGDDFFWLGAGADTLGLTSGANLAFLDLGADSVLGGAGNDTLDGGTESDRIEGAAGNDLLVGAEGRDTILGGAGNDTIFAGADDDSVLGAGAGADADTAYGEAGNDTITLGSGPFAQVSISGGLGDDLLTASGLVNRVEGDAGADTLTGSDVVSGVGLAQVTASNTLSGGADNDRLVGRAGSDSLQGGTGADTLVGGGGSDTYAIDSLLDVIEDSLADSNNPLVTPQGDLVRSSVSFTLTDTLERLELLLGGLTGTGNSGANTMIGSAGADTILGGLGADSITGGSGADVLKGNGVGGVGAEADTIRGGGGGDVIEAGNLLSAVSLFGDAGNDTITSTGYGSTLEGGDDDDVLLGSSQGFGPNPALTVYSGDVLRGGAGNDSLVGGKGSDELTGGSGADTFSYAAGDSGQMVQAFFSGGDVITDFSRAEGDRIDLSAIDADGLTAGDQAFDELLPSSSATPIGPGSLRYTVGAGATTIDGSTDNDATPEIRIIIEVPGYIPQLSDFIL